MGNPRIVAQSLDLSFLQDNSQIVPICNLCITAVCKLTHVQFTGTKKCPYGHGLACRWKGLKVDGLTSSLQAKMVVFVALGRKGSSTVSDNVI